MIPKSEIQHKWQRIPRTDASECVKCFCIKWPVYQVIAKRYKKIVATTYILRGVHSSKAPICVPAITINESEAFKGFM